MEQVGLIVGIIGGTLGAIGVVASIVLGVVTWKRSKRMDMNSEIVTDTGMRIAIEYIKRGVDQIQVTQQRMQDDIGHMSERITRCEESCKSAHHRIDELPK